MIGSGFDDYLVLESLDAANLQVRSTGADFYNVTNGTLVKALAFANPTTGLTIELGVGKDSLTLGSIHAAFTANRTYDGGLGEDTFQANDDSNTWSISGLNSGSFNGTASFSNVEILVGGTAQDSFVFANGASVDGWVDGGSGGVDTLDYHLVSTSMTLELNDGNKNIDSVIGGSGVDTLVGISRADRNVWTINANDAGSVVSTSTSSMSLNTVTTVDTISDSLRFPFDHTFFDGQSVTYHSTLANVGGLANGTSYHILVVNSDTIKLTSTPASVVDLSDNAWSSGTRTLVRTTPSSITVPFQNEEVEGADNTITFESSHGLSDNDQVTYSYTGDGDDSNLTNGTSYFVLVVDSKTIKLLETAPAVTALSGTGATNWPTGESSLNDLQTVGNVSFSGFENLTGGSVDDDFVFVSNSNVSGIIDGGAGENTLDHSARTTALMINLGNNSVNNIGNVISGSNSADTLIGPTQNSLWNVTGANSGTVSGIAFTAFENLTGAANNRDGFIVRASGSVSGTIDGGASGRDAFAIEDPATPGNLAVVIPEAGGSGTVSANAIYSSTAAVSFAGMENSFFADTSVVGTVTLYGTPFQDTLALSLSSSTITLTETSSSRFFWDSGTSAFAPKSFGFAESGGSLETSFDLDDTLTFGAFSPSQKTDLILDRSDYLFTSNVFTRGGRLSVNADSITVAPNITLSTRTTDLSGNSTADSGDILLLGNSITVGQNAQILAYDDRSASVDPKGFAAAIDGIAFPAVRLNSSIPLVGGDSVQVFKPGSVHYNVATRTDGAGTGMTVDIVVDSKGQVEVLLHNHGSGYTDNANVWIEIQALGVRDAISISMLKFTDVDGVDKDQVEENIDYNVVIEGGNTAKVATFTVNGLLNRGGDIALFALNHNFDLGAFGTQTTTASINIEANALIHGRQVAIRADADNLAPSTLLTTPPSIEDQKMSFGPVTSNYGQEIKSKESPLENVIENLLKLRPFVGIGMVEAHSTVTIGANASIIADSDVAISSKARSAVALTIFGFGLGFGYARSEADSTITIASNASIHAEGSVQVLSIATNEMDQSVKVSGLNASPTQIAVSITETYSHSTIAISSDALLTADGGDVQIVTANTKKISNLAKGTADFSPVALGVTIDLSEAISETIVDGNITASGDISTVALTSSDKNRSSSDASIGTGLIDKLKRKYDPRSIIRNKAIAGGRAALGELVGNNKLGKLIKGDPNNPSSTKWQKLGVSSAVSVTEHTNTASNRTGATARIDAGGDITILADVVDRPDILATTKVQAGTDPLSQKVTPKQYAGAVSVSYGQYTNTANAFVASGAELDAIGPLNVLSNAILPYDFPLESLLGVNDGIGRVAEVLGSTNFGATSSWARSSAEGTKFGISGSANVLKLDTTANAAIDSGARINKKHANAVAGDVNVKATTELQIVNLSGNFKLFGLAKNGGAGGGGSFGGVFYDTVTTATIGAGAVIDAANLDVDAKSNTMNVSVGITGGKANTYAINGALNWVELNNRTLAQIDDGAVVVATGTVDVNANDDLFNLNIAGGVTIGKSVGFGLTGAVNVIERDTQAITGNRQTLLGNADFAPGTGVNDTSNTVNLGYAHGFANGDSVRYSDGGSLRSIGGLTDGSTYFVTVVSANSIKLSTSAADLPGTVVDLTADGNRDTSHNISRTFNPSTAVNNTSDAIDLGYAHGFTTGQKVNYSHGGGQNIGGLENKSDYFVIVVPNSNQIKLALTLEDALRGLSIDIDKSQATGSAHSFGVPFRAIPIVDTSTNTIKVTGSRAYYNSQPVVYDNGGGTSIGGLTDNNGATKYFVKVIDSTTIQLYAEPALTNLISINPNLATGANHSLLDPSDLNGILSAGGRTTIHAENEGLIVSATLAAAKTDDTPADPEAPEASGGSKFGIAASGSVSINTIHDSTQATVLNANLTNVSGLSVLAANSTNDTAISGAAAVSTNKKRAAGLAGAVTINHVSNETHASIQHSTLTNVGAVTVESDATGKILSIAAGLSGASRGVAVAGSVAINSIDSDTTAYVNNGSSVAGTSQSVSVTAEDSATITTVAGSIAYGGKAGIGAGISLNTITGGAQASVSDSDIDVSGALTVDAKNEASITSVAAGLAILAGTGSVESAPGSSVNGIAAALGLSINSIDADNRANISNSTNTITAGSLSVTATDDSSITGAGGGVAIGLAKGVTAGATAAAAGAGLAFNSIEHKTQATLDNARLSIAGSVLVHASSEGSIDALAIAGAGAVAIAGAKGAGVALAGAAAGSFNSINQTIESLVNNSTVTTTNLGNVQVLASDSAAINADTGGVSVAIAAAAKGAGVAIAIGASVSVNRIGADNDVPGSGRIAARVSNSTVNSAGSVTVNANTSSSIDTLAIGGAGSVGASSTSAGVSLAGAGAGSYASIRQDVIAEIVAASEVTAIGTLDVSASDQSVIRADAIGAAIAVGGSSSGTGFAGAIGVSISDNSIENNVKAWVDSSTVTAGIVQVDARAFGRQKLILAQSGPMEVNNLQLDDASQKTTDLATTTNIDEFSEDVNDDSAILENLFRQVAGIGPTAPLPTNIPRSLKLTQLATKLIPNALEPSNPTRVGTSWLLTDELHGTVYIVNQVGNNLIVFENSITAMAVAASVSVGAGGGNGLALSGGGASTQNTVTSSTKASIEKSVVTTSLSNGSSGNITVNALSTSGIISTVVAASASVGASTGGNGGALAIGAAIAKNSIGYVDGTRDASSITALIEDSEVYAAGDVTVQAINQASIGTTIIAVSAAVSAASSNALSLGGAGASAVNQIGIETLAKISQIDAEKFRSQDVAVIANDRSAIQSLAGAAALTVAASGGNSGALSIGVGLAKNIIHSSALAQLDNVVFEKYSTESVLVKPASGALPNDIRSFSYRDFAVGDITVTALTNGSIDSVAFAASLAAGFGSSNGVALAGAGAEATNIIGGPTEATISNSRIANNGKVDLNASSSSEIYSDVLSIAVSLAGGSTAGVGASIGVSLSQNFVGYDDNACVSVTHSGNLPRTITIHPNDTLQIANGPGAGDIYQYIGTVALSDPEPSAANSNWLAKLDFNDATKWQLCNLFEQGGLVQTRLHNSSIVSAGDLTADAIANQKINSQVTSASAAISGAGTGAISVSGAGVGALNRIAMNVVSTIDGDSNSVNPAAPHTSYKGPDGVILYTGADVGIASVRPNALSTSFVGSGLPSIHVRSVTLTANDTSTIDSLAGAVSIAAAFAGAGAGSLAVSASVAENRIHNDVEAKIINATHGVFTSGSSDVGNSYNITAERRGDVKLIAVENATIQSLSFAASLAAAAGSLAVSLAGAGATALNVIQDQVSTEIVDSFVSAYGKTAVSSDGVTVGVTSADVSLSATNTSTIKSEVIAVSAAIAGGEFAGAGSIGVALAKNIVGTRGAASGANSHGTYAAIINSEVSATGDVTLDSIRSETVQTLSAAGSVAIAIGIGGAGSATGTTSSTILAGDTHAWMSNSSVVAGGDVELNADSKAKVTEAVAVGASVAVAIGALSVAVTLVENTLDNDVRAKIEGTASNHVAALGNISVIANGSEMTIDNVTGVTASLSAGLVTASAGGMSLANTIDNTIASHISGAIEVHAAGNVSVQAVETAWIDADATAVTVAISLVPLI